MNAAAPAILWFRNDLRLADNPALSAAVGSGASIVALYILDEAAPGEWRPGGASRWYLHHSLAALVAELATRGVPLILRRGSADLVLAGVVQETRAKAVYWNRIYEPWAVRRDSEIKARLKHEGLAVKSFNGSLLFEPSSFRSGKGQPFRVFAPFWRACLVAPPPGEPLPAPDQFHPAPAIGSDRLDDWRLLPKRPDWAGGLHETWEGGEAAARRRLAAFAKEGAAPYGAQRDLVAEEGVSRLSPALHFGEVSPRQVWRDVFDSAGETAAPYLRQLGWREFAHQLLVTNPQMPERPLDPRFEEFPWESDYSLLTAWQRGQTGYPLVDAAMRQLWRTGWMHNRARLVAASFLVKHLLLPWQEGERWFWDTLVDADLANNSMNWQWTAGCGADAAPFFRIFNPVLQGEKFDPDGAYVRRYAPELAGLSAKFIHRPWEAPASLLREAGVRLGETYPHRIVEHEKARTRALAAFAAIAKP